LPCFRSDVREWTGTLDWVFAEYRADRRFTKWDAAMGLVSSGRETPTAIFDELVACGARKEAGEKLHDGLLFSVRTAKTPNDRALFGID
jgi:hypothetical protein